MMSVLRCWKRMKAVEPETQGNGRALVNTNENFSSRCIQIAVGSKTLILSRDLDTWWTLHICLGNILRWREHKDIRGERIEQIPVSRLSPSLRPKIDGGCVSATVHGDPGEFDGLAAHGGHGEVDGHVDGHFESGHRGHCERECHGHIDTGIMDTVSVGVMGTV